MSIPFRVASVAALVAGVVDARVSLPQPCLGPLVFFARPHRSLSKPYPRTPAMAAGMADHVWTCEEIAALLD